MLSLYVSQCLTMSQLLLKELEVCLTMSQNVSRHLMASHNVS
jgi:hypothetical protein